jgi:hypothetical protein
MARRCKVNVARYLDSPMGDFIFNMLNQNITTSQFPMGATAQSTANSLNSGLTAALSKGIGKYFSIWVKVAGDMLWLLDGDML